MRMPRREEHMTPRHYQAARVLLSCPTVDTHTRSLILEQATIYADGWACWAEDGHVYVGYVQAGSCCDAPAVSEGERGIPWDSSPVGEQNSRPQQERAHG